ncbi:hypothetical protein [Methylocystis heyeri]|jgi:hypothetical protein|uniref:Uncharacterized protein n=1 Tax=Methylocystis heyeri TaxID=391905 RepID=A0A6B8KEM3_9HYPH|nr:hypothetical protein [Methylocystis heyeri]QGM45028.1 hypothetical protein H2LOC_004625 [Methylocystis heyeri]
MGVRTREPGDIAKRIAQRARLASPTGRNDGWRRETFTLARGDAREKAREWFELYPKAAYMTEIEFWRELEDGRIEFTIRRLPSAD